MTDLKLAAFLENGGMQVASDLSYLAHLSVADRVDTQHCRLWVSMPELGFQGEGFRFMHMGLCAQRRGTLITGVMVSTA